MASRKWAGGNSGLNSWCWRCPSVCEPCSEIPRNALCEPGYLHIRVFGGLRPCLQGLLGHLPTDLRESATRVHSILGCRACGQPISAARKESHHGRWRHIDLEVSNPVVGFGKAHNNGQSGSALQGAFFPKQEPFGVLSSEKKVSRAWPDGCHALRACGLPWSPIMGTIEAIRVGGCHALRACALPWSRTMSTIGVTRFGPVVSHGLRS